MSGLLNLGTLVLRCSYQGFVTVPVFTSHSIFTQLLSSSGQKVVSKGMIVCWPTITEAVTMVNRYKRKRNNEERKEKEKEEKQQKKTKVSTGSESTSIA